jgi:hypothetical protein
MDYFRYLLGMPDLNKYELIFKIIMISLFAFFGLVFILNHLKLIPSFGKISSLSFYFLGIAMMMLFIPSFHTDIPFDPWLFGAMLGTFVGAAFSTFDFTRKEFYLNTIIFLIAGIGIGIYTTKYLV